MQFLKVPFRGKIKKTKPKGVFAHENFPGTKYAQDFLLKAGTKIYAAREGVVILTKSRYSTWGPHPKYAGKANLVAIQHHDGTYAEYMHLSKGGVLVRKGQKVKTGDPIGFIGYSGTMDVPHLHLNVFKVIGNKKRRGISIPFRLKKK